MKYLSISVQNLTTEVCEFWHIDLVLVSLKQAALLVNIWNNYLIQYMQLPTRKEVSTLQKASQLSLSFNDLFPAKNSVDIYLYIYLSLFGSLIPQPIDFKRTFSFKFPCGTLWL